ncbi:MAG: type II 3-dehydroquinate dehydratase [Rhodospirillaceae bacterium]
MSRLIYIINGPNLNLLGTREPEIYGRTTLDDIRRLASECADSEGLEIEFRQANEEGTLVTWIQEADEKGAGIIVNGAGYTHTSVAIMDALLAVSVPVIEVHLSNIYKREEFRHHSYISRAAYGIICGFGANVYPLGIQAMARFLESDKT